MKLMRNIFGVLLLFTAFLTQAQDIHFSQFYASPLTLNPAMTGYVNGSCRAGFMYRSQWGTVTKPFMTISGSYEHVLEVWNHQIGVGGMVFSDRAAETVLTNNSIFGSAAIQHDLGGGNLIMFGLQGGYIQRSIDLNGISFPDQWDGSTYNLTQPNNENPSALSLNYYDLNLGAMYAGSASDDVSFYAGISTWHLLFPKESFLNSQSQKVPFRMTLHGGAKWNINDDLSLLPNLIFMSQKKAMELNLGAAVDYVKVNRDNKYRSFGGGLYYRNAYNSDAIIIMGGIGFDKILAGISYDFNISGLTNASRGLGGLELSLRYICPPKPENKIKAVACPRY